MTDKRKKNSHSSKRKEVTPNALKCSSCLIKSEWNYTISDNSVVLKCTNCGSFANLSSYATYKNPSEFYAQDIDINNICANKLNLCKLHTIGRKTSGLPISIQVLLNALYNSRPLTFHEIAKMYGALDFDVPKVTGFISEIITAANKKSALFKVVKDPDQPKVVYLSPLGITSYCKIDQKIGGFPPKGVAQMMFGFLAREHGVAFNILALIDAIGEGSTYSDLALRYGVPNHDARTYGFIGTLIKNTNKTRENPLFSVGVATEENLIMAGLEGDFNRKPQWVNLTSDGKVIYNELQKLKQSHSKKKK